MTPWYEKLSKKVEDNAFKLGLWTTIAILVGGLIEIPPLFLQGSVKKIDNVKPYSALELAGRDVYQEEGCFYCHSQMIRPFKWETDRWDPTRSYGDTPYSKAGEYVYDHPFLWGSKRIGPDLAHEAALRGSDAWQVKHLIDPRETSPDSIMPAYPHLFESDNLVDPEGIQDRMNALKTIGVPYSEQEIQGAAAIVKGKTKGDALVAYLLKLGRDTKQK
ncbi:MAG: cytochrome-c oxidase, cbb3-type subunit II [Spirochaetia bacterium]|nr:cytochrome-c oxidase, cbb3-type subunit II [Spirochaetia bacterium]